MSEHDNEIRHIVNRYANVDKVAMDMIVADMAIYICDVQLVCIDKARSIVEGVGNGTVQ